MLALIIKINFDKLILIIIQSCLVIFLTMLLKIFFYFYDFQVDFKIYFDSMKIITGILID